MTAPVLEVIDVRKSFRGRGWRAPRHAVLDGVSFAVGAGEAVGLVGGSGVGKTTIARLVVGLEQPDAGRILFEGREVWHERGEAMRAARQRVHLVFQDPYDALPPSMRVRDIVAEPLTIHGVGTRAERVARVREALEDAALTPADRFLDRYPQELSGGERQRVALARAVILRPRLIVADEPTTMLDMSLRLDLLALMKRLGRQHGISYLYITHDLALARSLLRPARDPARGPRRRAGAGRRSHRAAAARLHEAPGRRRRHLAWSEHVRRRSAAEPREEVRDRVPPVRRAHGHAQKLDGEHERTADEVAGCGRPRVRTS